MKSSFTPQTCAFYFVFFHFLHLVSFRGLFIFMCFVSFEFCSLCFFFGHFFCCWHSPPPPIFLWICGLFVTQSLNITLLFSLIPLFTSWWVTVCTFWVLLMTALHNKFLNNLSLQTPLFPLTELTPHLNSVFQIDSPWWKNCIKQF